MASQRPPGASRWRVRLMEKADFGEGTRTNLGILSLHFFNPGVVNRNMLQPQFDDGLLQESGFLLHGVDHADGQFRLGDGQRDARQAAATADVEQITSADLGGE